MEGLRRSCALCDVVGGRPGLRAGGRLLHQPVLLPELRHSIQFTGEITLDGRLPVCQQGIQLNDIVVFNFPAGDTICSAPQYQAYDYYQLCYQIGYELYKQRPNPDSLSQEQLPHYFNTIYQAGKQIIEANPQEYGLIDTRPTDRRENYVKRCVGLPGQTLQIKDRTIYINGKANKEPDNVQYTYKIKLKRHFTDEEMKEWGITMEELKDLNNYGYMPMTNKTADILKKRSD